MPSNVLPIRQYDANIFKMSQPAKSACDFFRSIFSVKNLQIAKLVLPLHSLNQWWIHLRARIRASHARHRGSNPLSTTKGRNESWGPFLLGRNRLQYLLQPFLFGR